MNKEEFVKMIEQLDITQIQEFTITYDDNSTNLQARRIEYSILE